MPRAREGFRCAGGAGSWLRAEIGSDAVDAAEERRRAKREKRKTKKEKRKNRIAVGVPIRRLSKLEKRADENSSTCVRDTTFELFFHAFSRLARPPVAVIAAGRERGPRGSRSIPRRAKRVEESRASNAASAEEVRDGGFR